MIAKFYSLDSGLDTGECSQEDIERAKALVPKQFEKYIESKWPRDKKIFPCGFSNNFFFENCLVYGTGQQPPPAADDVTENWDLYDTLNSTKLEQMSDEEDEQEEYNSDELSGDE